MFRYNDKVTLTVLNAVNKKDKVVDLVLSLPFEDDIDLSIPNDIIQVSIFEYHEGREINGYESFKICVGKETNLRHAMELQRAGMNIDITPYALADIETSEDRLCYFEKEDGSSIIFAKLNKSDILVEDTEALKFVLYFISDKFKNIENSLFDIKSINEIKKKKLNMKS